MKKIICGLVVALGSGFVLLAADNDNVFVGTWKMNVAKSSAMQFAGDKGLIKKSEIKDDVMVVTVEGETTTVREHSTLSGQPVSSAFTVPLGGGPLNFSEGAPPAGITDASKKIDDLTTEITSTMNGNVILTTRARVSPNHKMMTITTSGADEKGKAFKTVTIYDRQ